MLHRLRTTSVRQNAVLLVLAALVFRSLIPPGFMLGTGQGTTLTVEFCPGVASHGMASHEMAAHHGDHGRPAGPGPDHGQHGTCPFAASALLAPPPIVFAAVVVGGAEVDAASLSADPILSPESARRPGARAPPTLA
jgi:hypothetical protein